MRLFGPDGPSMAGSDALATERFRGMNRDFWVIADNAEKVIRRHEPHLRGYERLSARFISSIGDDGAQTDDFSSVDNAQDHGFSILGHAGELGPPLAHDEHASRRLTFGREHRMLRMAGRVAASVQFPK